MTLRADHVAGAAFAAFGILIIATSGDLPIGSLSFPASGFMPKILAGLMIVFGGALILRAGENQPFAAIDWSDLKHAGPVVIITALATVLYTELGFVLTFVLMMLASSRYRVTARPSGRAPSIGRRRDRNRRAGSA